MRMIPEYITNKFCTMYSLRKIERERERKIERMICVCVCVHDICICEKITRSKT